MDELQVPAFYILNRQLEKEQVGPIVQALNITPVFSALISDIHDAELGLMFAPQVMRCRTEKDCCDVALAMSAQHNMPILVVGTAICLDAVYKDGTRHPVGAEA